MEENLRNLGEYENSQFLGKFIFTIKLLDPVFFNLNFFLYFFEELIG